MTPDNSYYPKSEVNPANNIIQMGISKKEKLIFDLVLQSSGDLIGSGENLDQLLNDIVLLATETIKKTR